MPVNIHEPYCSFLQQMTKNQIKILLDDILIRNGHNLWVNPVESVHCLAYRTCQMVHIFSQH